MGREARVRRLLRHPRRVKSLIAAFAVMVCLASCGLQQDLTPQGGTITVTPTAAPAITADTVSGHTFNLRQERGHPVVIDFFGSWCGPCRAEQPSLSQIARTFQSKGVVFIGIAMRDDPTAVSGFESDYAVPYPAVLDDGTYAADYGVDAPPTAVVVNAQGQIVAKYLATTTGMQTELSTLIRG